MSPDERPRPLALASPHLTHRILSTVAAGSLVSNLHHQHRLLNSSNLSRALAVPDLLNLAAVRIEANGGDTAGVEAPRIIVARRTSSARLGHPPESGAPTWKVSDQDEGEEVGRPSRVPVAPSAARPRDAGEDDYSPVRHLSRDARTFSRRAIEHSSRLVGPELEEQKVYHRTLSGRRDPLSNL